MLSRLFVSNLAVVERAEVCFAAGLNVLTGETGAGKSVLMGALELVLGGRADSALVRDGAREARVEGVFTLDGDAASDIANVCAEAGIEFEPGEELVLRRTVNANGGGKVWINDCTSTVATLKKIGRRLVDIHGPRANQSILEESFQRQVLDSFGGIETDKYRAAWEALCALEKEKAALENAEESEEEMDLLRYQLAELAEAEITEEDETLSERHSAASHAGDIVESANEMTELLGGDGGVVDLLAKLQTRLAGISRYMPAAEEWQKESDEIAIRVEELNRAIADEASKIDADPAELERLDARLGIVNRIRRKYLKGETEGEEGFSRRIAAIEHAKRERLAALEGREEKLAKLDKALDTAKQNALKAAAAMRTKRAKRGAMLAKVITKELRDLGFLQASFGVNVEEAPLSANGADKVVFLFEPNPGESARALSDIASSGEIARVMLAVKSVLAAHDKTDLLVFDEIDANIGGETGKAVGRKMRFVAQAHQVIAITHLPQSAAYATRHLVVSKNVEGGRTRTRIEPVEGDARALELSRMLGGGSVAARKHAEELLREASC